MSLKIYSGPKITWKCHACDESFDTEHRFKVHKKTVHAANTIPCRECGKSFRNKQSLRQHKSLHRAKEETCPLCGKQFMGSRNLKTHLASMHSDKHKCNQCDFFTGVLGSYKQHMQTHLPKSEEKEICRIQSDLEKVHQDETALEERKDLEGDPGEESQLITNHFCGPCDLYFSTDGGLQEHFAEWHPVSESLYLCPECGKTLSCAANLRLHFRNVHANEVMKCPQCEYTTRNPQLMRRHTKNVHGTDFKCSHCPHTFGTAFYLEKHERAEHSAAVPRNSCPICGKVWKDRHQLQKHLKNKHKVEPVEEELIVEEDLEEETHFDDHEDAEDSMEEIIIESPECIVEEQVSLKAEYDDMERDETVEDEDYKQPSIKVEKEIEIEESPYHSTESSEEETADHETELKDNSPDAKNHNELSQKDKPFTITSLDKELKDAYVTLYNQFCTFRCEDCLDDQDGQGLVLSNYEEMRVHFQENHNSAGYAFCCGKKISKRAMTMHIKSHSRSNTCSLCATVFIRQSGLRRHLRDVHQKMPVDETPDLMADCDRFFQYRCEECGDQKPLKNFAEMRAHFEGEHQSIGYVFCCQQKIPRTICQAHLGFHLTPEKYTCKRCKLVLPSIPSLGRHVKQNACDKMANDKKGEVAIRLPTKKKICSLDSQSPDQKSARLDQMQEYDRLFQYQCEECLDQSGMHMLLRNCKEMQEHFKSTHNGPGYGFCCGKKIMRIRFSDHLQFHQLPNGHQCQECEKSFMKKSVLVKHIRVVHQNIRSRVANADRRRCGVCDIRFETYEDFLRHQKEKHQPPATCDICGKSLTNVKGLRQHIKECHSTEAVEEQDLVCPHCDKICKTKESLRLHVRNKHTNPDLICPFCGYSTKFSNCIKLHLAKHDVQAAPLYPVPQDQDF